jgi:hypothetical protein
VVAGGDFTAGFFYWLDSARGPTGAGRSPCDRAVGRIHQPGETCNALGQPISGGNGSDGDPIPIPLDLILVVIYIEKYI